MDSLSIRRRVISSLIYRHSGIIVDKGLFIDRCLSSRERNLSRFSRSRLKSSSLSATRRRARFPNKEYRCRLRLFKRLRIQHRNMNAFFTGGGGGRVEAIRANRFPQIASRTDDLGRPINFYRWRYLVKDDGGGMEFLDCSFPLSGDEGGGGDERKIYTADIYGAIHNVTRSRDQIKDNFSLRLSVSRSFSLKQIFIRDADVNARSDLRGKLPDNGARRCPLVVVVVAK